MKKLLIYLKDYKKESFLAPLFKMLEAIFELIVPLVVASIIDNGILNNDKGFIISRSGILVLLAVVGMIAAITAQYFVEWRKHGVFEGGFSGGYSICEIAKRHKVSAGCIKTNLCRNRKKLFHILEQEVMGQ